MSNGKIKVPKDYPVSADIEDRRRENELAERERRYLLQSYYKRTPEEYGREMSRQTEFEMAREAYEASTPEQRYKLEEWHSRRGGRYARRHGRRR